MSFPDFIYIDFNGIKRLYDYLYVFNYFENKINFVSNVKCGKQELYNIQYNGIWTMFLKLLL